MRVHSKSNIRVVASGLVAVVFAVVVAACVKGDSGSSIQPICDGTAAAGGVNVIVAPSPCDALVSVPSDCPLPLMCQITVTNNNIEDIDVRMISGSVSVPALDFTVLTGQNMVRDVLYSCGADIDEMGLLEIDVSLAGGPGAFCGRDVAWSVTVTPDP